jgi:hypothetical protein
MAPATFRSAIYSRLNGLRAVIGKFTGFKVNKVPSLFYSEPSARKLFNPIVKILQNNAPGSKPHQRDYIFADKRLPSV